MNKDDFASLKRGLAQVEAYQTGARKGFGIHEPVDIKAIRTANNLTQTEFARVYHLPVGTVRDWEQGRSAPDAPARVLLGLIQRDPERVRELIEG